MYVAVRAAGDPTRCTAARARRRRRARPRAAARTTCARWPSGSTRNVARPRVTAALVGALRGGRARARGGRHLRRRSRTPSRSARARSACAWRSARAAATSCGSSCGRGSRPVAGGLVLGLAGAWARSRVLVALLYGVSATDPRRVRRRRAVPRRASRSSPRTSPPGARRASTRRSCSRRSDCPRAATAIHRDPAVRCCSTSGTPSASCSPRPASRSSRRCRSRSGSARTRRSSASANALLLRPLRGDGRAGARVPQPPQPAHVRRARRRCAEHAAGAFADVVRRAHGAARAHRRRRAGEAHRLDRRRRATSRRSACAPRSAACSPAPTRRASAQLLVVLSHRYWQRAARRRPRGGRARAAHQRAAVHGRRRDGAGRSRAP